MTAPSPLTVSYDYEADYRSGDTWTPLPVTLITPSVNADRVPYATAELTLTAIDEDTFTALDPRTLHPEEGGQVRWRMRQLDPAGNVIGHLPRVGSNTGDYAIMHVRSLTRTIDTVILTLHTAESLLDDKLCMYPIDGPGTNATNRVLLDWIIQYVIGRTRPTGAPPQVVTAADEHAQDVLDTGHGWHNSGNSLIRFGESYLEAVETELNSLDVRLVDAWGLGWYAATRGIPPTYDDAPTIVKLGAYTTDATHTLPEDVDPIVTGLEQTVARDGDWADTIILDGEHTDGLYADRWQQTAGRGDFTLNGYAPSRAAVEAIDAQTRGRIIRIDRTAPSGNLAQSIATRALTRGHDLTVTARARFDVLPGMTLEVHLRESTLTATILAVSWNLELGTMSILAQSATTAPPVISAATRDQQATAVRQALTTVEGAAAGVVPLTRRVDALIAGIPTAGQVTSRFGSK